MDVNLCNEDILTIHPYEHHIDTNTKSINQTISFQLQIQLRGIYVLLSPYNNPYSYIIYNSSTNQCSINTTSIHKRASKPTLWKVEYDVEDKSYYIYTWNKTKTKKFYLSLNNMNYLLYCYDLEYLNNNDEYMYSFHIDIRHNTNTSLINHIDIQHNHIHILTNTNNSNNNQNNQNEEIKEENNQKEEIKITNNNYIIPTPITPITPATPITPINNLNINYNEFLRNGYLKLNNMIPLYIIKYIKKKLNLGLGTIDSLIEGSDDTFNNSNHIIGKLSGSYISDIYIQLLFHSYIKLISELFCGNGKVSNTYGCQIALRFPSAYIINDNIYNELNININNTCQLIGTSWHSDGERQGKTHPFSLLIGVLLHDIDDINQGNLCIWPGSHHLIHQIQHHINGSYNLNIKENQKIFQYINTEIEPIQMKGKAGDVIIIHPELAHCGGPNFSESIRYMLYYRIKHISYDIFKQNNLYNNNIFIDLENLPQNNNNNNNNEKNES